MRFISLVRSGSFEPEFVRADRIASVAPNKSRLLEGESFVRWVDDGPPVVYVETPEAIVKMVEAALA